MLTQLDFLQFRSKNSIGLAVGLVGVGFIATCRIRQHVTKALHYFVTCAVSTLRLEKGYIRRNKSKVEEKVSTDITCGYLIPSASHVAFELMLWPLLRFHTTIRISRFLISKTPQNDTSYKSSQFKRSVIVVGKADLQVKVLKITHENCLADFAHVAVLFIHGGGHTSASPENFLGPIVELSAVTRLTVFAPDYVLCPEYSLEHQLAQCVGCYQFLRKQGKKIILVGDSAGGGSVVGMIQQIVALNDNDALIGAVMISPYIDLKAEGESVKKNVNIDALINAPIMKVVSKACSRNGDLNSLTDPKLNYIYGEFKGFPPCYITVSETELLYSVSVRLYKYLRNAGASVLIESMPYGVHDFPLFYEFAPEYKESFLRLCRFIRVRAGMDKALTL